jgi:hypothetical protein
MASLEDQHQNRAVLLGLKIPRLVSLAKQPIAAQIKEFDSLDTWRQQYLQFKIPNEKVDQIVALESLEKWLRGERSKAEKSLTIDIQFNEMPSSKRLQYEERLRRLGEPSEWSKCFVRMYTAAEWAVEKWARAAGLECIDLNAANPYDPQDYTIGDHNVDVKTTIRVGRRGRRELKSYWSPDNLPLTEEVICAVTSTSDSSDAPKSQHCIQGIFCSLIYDKISVGLNYFKLDRNLLNVCYFQPPAIFFDREALAPQVPPPDADVVEYCVENGRYLEAIFHLPTRDVAALLRKALPSCHHDFVPTAAELMSRQKRQLLPHYAADYLLGKIVHQESIDKEVVEEVLWSIFEPSEDQKKYLRFLMQAWKILPRVRCAHCGEGIERMDVEPNWGERAKLILRARCATDRKLTTTFLAYSWKTFDALLYGERGISVCDAPDCGCLTHVYDDPETGRRTIGRRNCSKYGEHAPELGKSPRG